MNTDWLPDASNLIRDVFPFIVILALVFRDSLAPRKRESQDVWTLRKTKKGR